jgi:undecaprenyl-diphosphatase
LARWGLPFALLALALAWAVMLLFGAMEFDRGLLILLYAGTHPRLADVARLVTELGGVTMLLAVASYGAAILIVRREYWTAGMLLGITFSGRMLVSLQKDWTARIRPDAQGQLVPVENFAFPSGHAANATIVWLCLALLLPQSERGRQMAVWAAAWIAIAVGASRVMLGVHWPSDVIGGWAFGLFWTLLWLRLSGRLDREGTPAPLPHSCPKGGRT